MHRSSYARMQWFVENYCHSPERNLSVLDIGSCAVNKDDPLQTYRPLFAEDKFSYTGLDMVTGPNVDIAVNNPYCWRELENNSFDVVISGQVFEHIEFFWETMKEIARVLKAGGLLSIVVPGPFGVAYHACPVDCYRFFADGMIAMARYAGLEVIHASSAAAPKNAPDIWYETRDSFLIARKSENHQLPDMADYIFEKPDFERMRSGFIPDNYENKVYYDMFAVRIDGSGTLHELKNMEMVYLWALPDDRFYIWGTGGQYELHYQTLVQRTRPKNFIGFLDSNPKMQGTELDEYPVMAPQNCAHDKPDVIIIASHARKEIMENIRNILSK
ncbi:methyltransferase domain-containing protein [Maridesulfovibrio sp.]|uniref:methyltransferase domain-containing protein n=1 Tax=Maridesulfovibrio sp. TaxID=2795000 RepID=UPI002A188EFC|nr:methyltransferase domain-containing protein [Maridesulfovibrio sp.]